MTSDKKTKGIILAGGTGSRLYPITKTACKQLLPVYDKPLINYPLTMMMQFGIKEILIITTPHDLPQFEHLFNNGSQFGLKISYEIQIRPEGIAQAFIIAENFIENDNVMLILGDNIFYGNFEFQKIIHSFDKGGMIFGYQVKNPNRFGVIECDDNGRTVKIVEKPKVTNSSYVVTGMYLYDADVVTIAKTLKKSARGEYEITDINNVYLNQGMLKVHKLDNNFVWLDTGTFDSLLEAGNFVCKIESDTGRKIGCVEETAVRLGYIDKLQLLFLIEKMPHNPYREYLVKFISEFYAAR